MAAIPANRIIIDTDPGVDDVIAILLALSAKSEELQVLLFSVVLGNTSVDKYEHSMYSIQPMADKRSQLSEKSHFDFSPSPRGKQVARCHWSLKCLQ